MCGLFDKPSIPKPPAPIPPPQASKAPDQEVYRRQNLSNSRGSANSGNSGTILTGSNGDMVPQGQLGTNTLLGG